MQDTLVDALGSGLSLLSSWLVIECHSFVLSGCLLLVLLGPGLTLVLIVLIFANWNPVPTMLMIVLVSRTHINLLILNLSLRRAPSKRSRHPTGVVAQVVEMFTSRYAVVGLLLIWAAHAE